MLSWIGTWNTIKSKPQPRSETEMWLNECCYGLGYPPMLTDVSPQIFTNICTQMHTNICAYLCPHLSPFVDNPI